LSKAPGWPATPSVGPVVLRPPRLRDARAWSEIRMRNEEWLAPWEPTSPLPWDERNSVGAWPALHSALRSSARKGLMLPFMITYGGRIVGQINVSNVVHGALRSCTVGYWVDGAMAGRGITPTALALAIDHCFGPVGLHRVEATVRPENLASRRVLTKLGFREEGMFVRYLSVAGAWRDHLGYALTVEEAADGLVSRLVRSGLAQRV
jgi:[ribosomal protein S5]-alanine N-acetyltransferase